MRVIGLLAVALLTLGSIFPAVVVAQKKGNAYFYVQEGHEKCFLDDLAAEVPITVTYHHIDDPGADCAIQFRNPQERVVYNHQVKQSNAFGKVAYLTKANGQHQVCVACASTQWFQAHQLKWTLSIDIGDTDLNIANLATAQHVQDLENAVGYVDRVLSIMHAEHDYERIQEEKLRDASESMNRRVVAFAIVQLSVMLVATVLSVTHLAKFFQAQKLY